MREPTRRFRGGAVVLVMAGACSSPLQRQRREHARVRLGGSPARATSTRLHHDLELHVLPDDAPRWPPGATVRVTNNDSVTHTLTATGGQFNTGDIGADQTKTFTAPTKPGTYHYICNIHQYMMGTIVVR